MVVVGWYELVRHLGSEGFFFVGLRNFVVKDLVEWHDAL